MLTSTFKGRTLSRLGFGAMRLPQKDGEIDAEQVFRMVDYALAHGVNYFDTAYPYHGGMSEIVLGRALARHPRGSFFLADKYPGHQIAETYDPAAVFEDQLRKCGVDYFDFYVLHNVYEKSVGVYEDPRWGIIDYFVEQRRLGRVRHLGFSSHAGLDTLAGFLDRHGAEMEFCQIQCNYMDWTLQKAREKVSLLASRGLPVWVMEPARGGRLATLPESAASRLRAARPGASPVSWAFRWLQGIPEVKVVLSGMSAMEQMTGNVETFSSDAPLSEEERALLLDVAEGMKDGVPCTACRYCCDGCPQGLDIPTLLRAYNDLRFSTNLTPSMLVEALPAEKRPSACLRCGACAAVCPQKIAVPDVLADLAARCAALPSWEATCRERAEAARRLAARR